MTAPDSDESRLTTDRETIRRWAEQHDVVPVRTSERETTVEDETPYWLRTETEHTETMETISWDEFFDKVDENELVILFHGENADRPLEVVNREQAVRHAPLEASELEERLLAGETVTSEVTETTVVERTIVEHATIESEIVETEVLDSRVIDVELRSREIGDWKVVEREGFDEVAHARFDDVDRLAEGVTEAFTQPIPIEATIDEDWTITRELLERATIESRIVDVDISGTDEVESETVESSIDIEGVQQALLESEMVETEADAATVIQSGTLESEFHEDDVVRTQLTQRRIVEESITERKLARGELTESDVLQAETQARTTIETGFLDEDSLDSDVSPVGVTSYETATDDAEPARDESERTTFTEDDEGKSVVAADGHPVGMVETVSAGTAYVNPEPGLVDRIKTRLGWGSADDGDYTLEAESVERITEDEVELSEPK